MSEDQNVIYVGKKPVMSYVLAIVTYFNDPNAKEVILKARGRAITIAVDVTEITRRRFMTTLAVEKISIGTEEIPGREDAQEQYHSWKSPSHAPM